MNSMGAFAAQLPSSGLAELSSQITTDSACDPVAGCVAIQRPAWPLDASLSGLAVA
jgi:hypothetical protein